VNKLPSIFLAFACALDFPLFYFILFYFMGQRLRAVASDLSLIIASGSVWESGSRLWYALNTIAISIIINKIQNSVTLIINQYGTVNYIKQENVYKIFFCFTSVLALAEH